MIKPEDKTVVVSPVKPYLVGKTIKKVDDKSVNCLNLEFTDGTCLMLEVVAVHGPLGLYGFEAYVLPEQIEKFQHSKPESPVGT